MEEGRQAGSQQGQGAQGARHPPEEPRPGQHALRRLREDSSLLLTVIERILLPAVYLYIGIAAASAVVEGEALERVGELLKKAVGWVLGGLLTVFVTYLTISGAVAGAADAHAVKAVTHSAPTAVPYRPSSSPPAGAALSITPSRIVPAMMAAAERMPEVTLWRPREPWRPWPSPCLC